VARLLENPNFAVRIYFQIYMLLQSTLERLIATVTSDFTIDTHHLTHMMYGSCGARVSFSIRSLSCHLLESLLCAFFRALREGEGEIDCNNSQPIAVIVT